MGCESWQESSCETETNLSRLASMRQLAPSCLHVRMTGTGIVASGSAPSSTVWSWIAANDS